MLPDQNIEQNINILTASQGNVLLASNHLFIIYFIYHSVQI